MSAKSKVARLSIISNMFLIAMKLVTGILTGSVSIIAETIHSTMDLLASLIAFTAVKISDKPADEDHPYGHGKVENISGVIEALLIFVASILIIKESVHKLISNVPIESIGLGFIVMFISAAVNYLVSRKIYKIAKEEDSIALEADALHLKADVYTSLGVGVGLLLISLTKQNYLDPIVGILVAIFILKEAYSLLKTAFNPLLDIKLSNDEVEIIKVAIEKYKDVYLNFHELRTRRSGSTRYIDLHLTLDKDMKVSKAHKISEDIEVEISKNIRNSNVIIHVEDCKKDCEKCKSHCMDE